MFGAGPFPIRKVSDAGCSEIQVGTEKLMARFIQKNDPKSSGSIFALDRPGPYKRWDIVLALTNVLENHLFTGLVLRNRCRQMYAKLINWNVT